MKSYEQSGESMPYSNAGAAIASGDVVVVTGIGIGIAKAAIAATTGTGELLMRGVVRLAKAAGEILQGARLYWDAGNKELTTVAAGNTMAGYAFETSSGDDIAVCLIPMGDTDPGDLKQADVVAALTENAGAIGGANDGDIPDLTATVAALDLNALVPDAQQDIVDGTVGDGTMGGAADGALETVGATNGGDVSGAIMNNFKDIQASLVLLTANDATLGTAIAELIADNVALRAAVRELAAKQNDVLTKVKAAGLMANA